MNVVPRASRAVFSSAVLYLGLFALTAPAAALDPEKAPSQYVLDVWQLEDGLPQSSILDIAQTPDGFLWLATYEGVARFDGAEFRTFEDVSLKAIRDQQIRTLATTPNGDLWLGTQEGLHRLRGGTLVSYTAAEGLPHDIVTAILPARGGGLWIGTQGGLARLDDGTFEVFSADSNGLPHDNVRALVEDGEGQLWIATPKGLGRLRDAQVTTFTTADGLVHDDVQTVLADHRGRLWIGTLGGGLGVFEDGRFAALTTEDGLPSDFVSALAEDGDGHLWIGTQDAGLARFRDGVVDRLGTAEGLSDIFVSALYEDREGSLWVGTFAGGLDRLKDGLFTTYTPRQGLGDDLVLGILEDRHGRLWFGTQGGLSVLEDGRIRTYTTADGLVHNVVWTLLESRDGTLWIGTWGGGVSRFKDGLFSNLTTADGLGDGDVRAILEDREGTVWIGTWGGGLTRWREDRLDTLTMADGLAQDVVITLHEDRGGRLWIGTNDGLSRLESGEFRTYTTRDGLANDVILSFIEDEDGTLWIGTEGGLTRLRDGVFTSFTTDDGLFNNRFFGLLEDDRGNFWSGSNQGVFRVAKSELEELARGERTSVHSTAYGPADGLASRECNGGFQHAGWKTRDGRLVFPTIRGASIIDPAALDRSPPAPIVILESLDTGNRLIPLGGGDPLELDVRNFTIRYTAPTFLDPARVRFSYRLEGHDTEWVDAGSRRVAIYQRVAPGEHRFRVRARTTDGAWEEVEASRSFSIRAAFHETWTFYLLCAVAVALTGRGLYRLGVRRLLRRNRELAETKEDLEEKNAELERFAYTVSHDLKNPIVTIRGFAGLLQHDLATGDRQRLERDIRHIQTAAATMQRLLDELVELARVGRVTSTPEEVALTEIAWEAAALLGRRIDERGVDLRIPRNLPTIRADRLRLLEVFQNIFENALKFLGSQGNPVIEVSAAEDDGIIIVSVRDNGIGIEPRYHERIFGIFNKLDPKSEGTGMGLALVQRIVELHGGRVWVESSGLGSGSTFRFTLPHPGVLPSGRRKP